MQVDHGKVSWANLYSCPFVYWVGVYYTKILGTGLHEIYEQTIYKCMGLCFVFLAPPTKRGGVIKTIGGKRGAEECRRIMTLLCIYTYILLYIYWDIIYSLQSYMMHELRTTHP